MHGDESTDSTLQYSTLQYSTVIKSKHSKYHMKAIQGNVIQTERNHQQLYTIFRNKESL